MELVSVITLVSVPLKVMKETFVIPQYMRNVQKISVLMVALVNRLLGTSFVLVLKDSVDLVVMNLYYLAVCQHLAVHLKTLHL
jgi:hypothetical protein